MKQKHAKYSIVVLAAILLLLIAVSVRLTRNDPTPSPTDGPVNQSQPTTVPTTLPSTPPASEPTESTEPTQTTPTETEPSAPTTPTETVPTEPPATEPTTPPTQAGVEYIGQLYTRDEIMAMSNQKFGYGPGPSGKDKRAEYAVAEQKKYAQYGANFIAPDNNCVYLTFDCGYEYTATDENGNKYRVTERILDVLKEKGVKGVFFVTMYYVKSQPDLVRRMIDEGHAVGNHTNNHPVMPDISVDKMVEEVMSLHNYVLEHFDYKMTLFRPPTGAYSVRSLAVVQSLGYKNVHWSFAYVDWDTEKQPEVASSLQKVKDCAHSGAIYLLHAVSTTNATLLGDAIDFFRAEGYDIPLFQ